jgi:VanZ family protein
LSRLDALSVAALAPGSILASVSKGQRAQRALVLILWMALLTLWSSQELLPIDTPQIKSLLLNQEHRLAHLASFGLLGLLAWWTFEGLPRTRMLALILVTLFGASDEWHQAFVPGRKAGVDDWLWDIFCGALAIYVWPRLPRLQKLAPIGVVAMFAIAVALLIRPYLRPLG